LIYLKKLVKEIKVNQGSYNFNWNWFTDFIPNSAADFYMDTVMDIQNEIRDGYLETPEQLKSRVDKFVNGMTSESKSSTKIGDNKFLMKYEAGGDLTFIIYDFGILYDKKTFSRSSEPQKIAVIGWIYGTGGTSEFGVHPKKIFQLNRVFRIHGSYVDKKQRGKGYGKILYNAIINDVDALVSDKILYAGSFGLWTNYIFNKSKFFGTVYEFKNTSIVVPVKKGEKIDKKSVSTFGPAGFVGIPRKIPTFLQKIAIGLKDISFSSLDIIDASGTKFTTKIQDLFDEATSMDDLFAQDDSSPYNPLADYLPYKWNDTQSPKALMYFKDALVLVKEVGDSIEWQLL
jgi:GNAT superfamily N-acetyltransferase